MGHPEDLLTILNQPATTAAPLLLGACIRHESPDGAVVVRLSEVEAYLGPRDSADPDPAAHSYGGKTNRNAVMFGPPGHLYVYFTYGMHYCANLVCRPEGLASGVLLRGGEVVEGADLARRRRPAARKASELAQGPARLAVALGLGREHNGVSVLQGEVTVRLPERARPQLVRNGPRVGVSGPGGSADYPWRFWLDGDPTVSRYKSGVVHGKRTTPENGSL